MTESQPQQMLVVEIDGGYHDDVVETEWKRREQQDSMGWKVLRFSDRDVEEDVDAIARAIASLLNLKYEFSPRQGTGSGIRSIRATKKSCV
jgi:very-short-patch-repair endonuclease